MSKALGLCIVWLFTFNYALALSNNYYSQELFNPATQTDTDTFRQILFENLSLYHIKQADHQPDIIVKKCPRNQRCTKHTFLSYTEARKVLMGNIHLETENQEYFINTLYCQEKMFARDFGSGRGPAPDRIPSHNILNAEHMWPQSRFSRNFPKKMQKADLHSLYPAKSKVNGMRGNLPFAEVSRVKKDICDNTKLGYTNRDTRTYFEPAPSVRGDIARALFYFSIRYKISIDKVQESYFRKWHIEDPVSALEISKNQKVYEAQKNRNPFVDHPEWVEFINNF